MPFGDVVNRVDSILSLADVIRHSGAAAVGIARQDGSNTEDAIRGIQTAITDLRAALAAPRPAPAPPGELEAALSDAAADAAGAAIAMRDPL